MREDALGTIEGLTTALGLQDVEAALAYHAPDAIHVRHADPVLMGLGGEYRGHDAIRSLLAGAAREWELLSWQCGSWVECGNLWRGRVTLVARHRATGLEFVETRRRIYQLEGRCVIRCEETLDDTRMRAFLAYARWVEDCRANPGEVDICA